MIRLVLLHRTGPRRGMYEICGYDQYPPDTTFVSPLKFNRGSLATEVSASIVSKTQRMVLYMEDPPADSAPAVGVLDCASKLPASWEPFVRPEP
jgi:hypothetical protein